MQFCTSQSLELNSEAECEESIIQEGSELGLTEDQALVVIMRGE